MATVQQWIDFLQKVEDKGLPVAVEQVDGSLLVNYGSGINADVLPYYADKAGSFDLFTTVRRPTSSKKVVGHALVITWSQ